MELYNFVVTVSVRSTGTMNTFARKEYAVQVPAKAIEEGLSPRDAEWKASQIAEETVFRAHESRHKLKPFETLDFRTNRAIFPKDLNAMGGMIETRDDIFVWPLPEVKPPGT